MTMPRRFHLQRHHDVTGASGTGRVADGVLWPDGTATLRWRGERASTVNWDRIDDAVAVHGHGGHTELLWDDPEPADGSSGLHVYLSTGCLHGEHAYCQSMTGQQGEKRPGRCKFCDARCTCSCHTEGETL